MPVDDALAVWLGLREEADAAARSADLTRLVARAVVGAPSIGILDLGTGTGSNVRYLAPRIGGRQRWLVIDRSPALLATIPARMAAWGAGRGYDVETRPDGCRVIGASLEVEIETRSLDLGTLAPAIFAGRDLVTASALLDLASEAWMRTLAAQCRQAGAAALFTLTYDGVSSCLPKEPEDDRIRDLLNGHQHRDKGLGGPAAGPGAGEAVARAFAEAGYRVQQRSTPWQLESQDREFQGQLVDGWADAAAQMVPADTDAILDWRARRLAHIDAGRSRIAVGHIDVGAWLPRDDRQ